MTTRRQVTVEFFRNGLWEPLVRFCKDNNHSLAQGARLLIGEALKARGYKREIID